MKALEDEIAKELSTQLQSEIDFQILSDMLVELGWHKVELIRFDSNRQAVDIKHSSIIKRELLVKIVVITIKQTVHLFLVLFKSFGSFFTHQSGNNGV